MGKFGNSDIHDKYSDWHWELTKINPKYKRLYVSDIDRLWIEYDFNINAIVAIIDIKWEGSIDDGLTATEKGIYEWFKGHGAKYYVVFITKDFTRFRVVDPENGERILSSVEYADFLLSLRTKRIWQDSRMNI